MELTGRIIAVLEAKSGTSSKTGNPWMMQGYVIEVPGQYPRHINFRVSDGQVGRIARFDSLIGKTVTVSFDIDAHEHEGRWFNEINAWGILEYINQTQRAANMVAAQNAQSPAPQPEAKEGGNDDMPFL